MVIYLVKRKKTWSVMKELLCACWTFYILMVFSMQIKKEINNKGFNDIIECKNN